MQTELNSREGTWERLCTEKDPQVLSCLMWSWLEQLKDPVITQEDVKILSEKKINLQNVINSLDKVIILIDHQIVTLKTTCVNLLFNSFFSSQCWQYFIYNKAFIPNSLHLLQVCSSFKLPPISIKPI